MRHAVPWNAVLKTRNVEMTKCMHTNKEKLFFLLKRSFLSNQPWALFQFWNHLPDHSLNCTPLIGIIIAVLTAIWADRNDIWFFILPFYFLNTPTNHRENMTRVHNMSAKNLHWSSIHTKLPTEAKKQVCSSSSLIFLVHPSCGPTLRFRE